jgi:phage terminase large subunit-like protein
LPVPAGPDAKRPRPSRGRRGQGAVQARGDDGPTASDADGELGVVDFIESHLRITKGDEAGQLVRLRDWQRTDLRELFRLRPDGSRQYRVGLYGLPRKNGKSAIGSGLALFGLFDQMGAEVYSCAGDKEQARIVFGEARKAIEADPELKALTKTYRDAIEVPQMGSIYRCLSAEAYTKEGLNPSLVIFDEVHVQPDDELWSVMLLGSGTRRNPLVLGITTAGVKVDPRGQPSLCYRLWEKGRAGGDDRFFFKWYAAPDKADYRDPAVWRAANPALGDYLFEEDFETVIQVIHENDFRTKRLNQWVSQAMAWLPQGAWEDREVARPFDPAEPFAVFLDGSWTNDSTGLVACTLGAPHLSVLGHWTPDPVLGHIDMEAVEKRVREVRAMPGFRGLAFDPAFLTDLFTRLEAEWNVGQREHLVAWPTNSLARMVPACQDFYTSVMERSLTHDGDPRLAQHIGNAVLKEDRHGPRIVKEAKGSPRKIDLAVCAVGALAEARRLGSVPVPTYRFISFDDD